MPADTWIVVLVKDFDTAKGRLAGVLSAEARTRLAMENAVRALAAALVLRPTLAICGSDAAAVTAAAQGATVIREAAPAGQNPAARTGLAEVLRRGGAAALLLSSDLPLVDADAVRRLLERADAEPGALVIAAPALGRAGTNALLLRPPGDFDLHFGEASLSRFAAEARRRGRRFLVHDDPALALDLDEPDDLETLTRLRATA